MVLLVGSIKILGTFQYLIYLKCSRNFLKNGIINRRTNETYICLIPQKKKANKVSDFCPISLISFLYKVIVKGLADRRLKVVLPCIISDCQAAFVQGRQIMDAILVASLTVEDWKLNNNKGFLLKLDLEKAQDKVDWNF